MSHRPLIASEVLSEAWELFKKEWVTLSGMTLMIFAITLVSSIALGGGFIAQSISNILSCLITLGMAYAVLKRVDGGPLQFENLFRFFNKDFWKYVLVNIAVSIAILIGFALLVIPGIILSMKLLWWPLLIADNRVNDPFESIKASWEMTSGQLGGIFMLGLACLGVILLGCLALMVGVIPAVGYLWVIAAMAYRRMSPNWKSTDSTGATPPPMSGLETKFPV